MNRKGNAARQKGGEREKRENEEKKNMINELSCSHYRFFFYSLPNSLAD